MRKKIKLTLMIAIILNSPFILKAEETSVLNQNSSTRARLTNIKQDHLFHKQIDEAIYVYESITNNSEAKIPSKVLRDTKCIVIIPDVMTGAFIIGGTHGEGVASCKNSEETWSHPTPISLSKGSIGLQAGAKSADMILFFISNKAVSALKKGRFSIGTDVSAIAGNFEAELDTSTAGVVVYTQTEGIFVGASMSGSQMNVNKNEFENYYGSKVNYQDILNGKIFPDETGYTDKLTKLFP
jgi:lipid-binding SYLF domain-containing protein